MLTTFIRIRRLTRFKHTHKCPAVGQPSSVDIIMTSGDACPTARPEKETFALPSIGLFFKTLPFDDALTDAPFHDSFCLSIAYAPFRFHLFYGILNLFQSHLFLPIGDIFRNDFPQLLAIPFIQNNPPFFSACIRSYIQCNSTAL